MAQRADISREMPMKGRRRISDERGVAILTVITLITVGMAVAGTAVVTATNVMRGSVRDESSKDAFAAAEAGAQTALHRQNQVAVNDANPCVVSSAGALAAGPASTGGWCAGFQGSVGDADYEYRVRPAVETGNESRIEIVSTGTANGVHRRIQLAAESLTSTAVFASNSVVGKDFIDLKSNADIFGSTGTNGSVTMEPTSQVCGAVTYGVAVNPSSYNGANCPSGYPFSKGQGTVSLPPVDQGNVTQEQFNHNDRIDPSNPNALDTISGPRSDVHWDPTNRTLEITSNSKLTLGGQNYSFCRLRLLSNAELIIAAGAQVRIFFDAPENCPTLGSGPQIFVDSGSKLTTTDGSPASLQLLVVGSSNPSVTSDNLEFNSNSTSTMPVVIYAPNSHVKLDSNSNLLGAVAAQSISLDSNAKITSDASAAGLELPVPLHYENPTFVECASTPAPPTAPSSNC
jgi:hypothetical protein